MRRFSYIFVMLLVLDSCKARHASRSSKSLKSRGSESQCILIFDAGSSGARLRTFEQTKTGIQQIKTFPIKVDIGISWALQHKDCNGHECNESDINNSIVKLIKDFSKANSGCSKELASVSVYATAGMRLAEQAAPDPVKQLYRSIKQAIRKELSNQGFSIADDQIQARTLTGIEEGIFTWITLNDLKKLNNKDRPYQGIIEMGGASMQLVFPCGENLTCNRNSPSIFFNGERVSLFVHSWLGLGLNEAVRYLNSGSQEREQPCSLKSFDPKACKAIINKVFRIDGTSFQVFDPLNFSPPDYRDLGHWVEVDIPKSMTFHGTGDFGFYNSMNFGNGVSSVCGHSPAMLRQMTSLKDLRESQLPLACFAFNYYSRLLQIPNLKMTSNERVIDESDVDWTRGAAYCESVKCLDELAPHCPWNLGGTCYSN